MFIIYFFSDIVLIFFWYLYKNQNIVRKKVYNEHIFVIVTWSNIQYHILLEK